MSRGVSCPINNKLKNVASANGIILSNKQLVEKRGFDKW